MPARAGREDTPCRACIPVADTAGATCGDPQQKVDVASVDALLSVRGRSVRLAYAGAADKYRRVADSDRPVQPPVDGADLVAVDDGRYLVDRVPLDGGVGVAAGEVCPYTVSGVAGGRGGPSALVEPM